MEREMQNQNALKATDYGNYRKEPIKETVDLPSMSKSELLEKLLFLENQIKQYNERLAPYDRIETFSNQGTASQTNSFFSCDIIDLMILIGIGLFIIFVMDSIFKMGKTMGAKGSLLL
jgi:hypothetical protein